MYNQGLFLYINDQKEEALFNLIQVEEKMYYFDNKPKQKNYSSIIRNGILASNSSLISLPYFEKKKLSYKSNNPIQLWKKVKIKEHNGYYNKKKIIL